MAESPSAGLELLQGVDEQLSGHYRLDAVRAHLLEMDGDLEAAREHYRAAAERATNLVEQRYLTTRAALLSRSAR
jgi:predicted RNA polymerase sigma factor